MRHTAPADAATSQPVADDLPAWDLSDLYPGPDSPALQADFAKAEQAAKAFYAAHQGKLANMSGGVLAAVIA
jgi:oligoendopeptidase F